MKIFRDNGAIGALLDEYEKAIKELQMVLENVTPEELTTVVDSETADKDCRSIQSILSHVIRAGYGYAIAVRKNQGEKIGILDREMLGSIQEYQNELSRMFKYNEQLFEDYPKLVLEEKDPKKKMLVSWGQLYDVEQLFEHAIVHILRHRRQIQRFLLKLRNTKGRA